MTAAGEFELIAQHLSALGVARAEIEIGVGDDAAIVDPSTNRELRCACRCVTLAGRSVRELAQDIKEAVQSLVDPLRADGFIPAWATLALTMPRSDEALVRALASAVHLACSAQGIAVIGGDTTRGDATLTVFVTGLKRY